MKTLKLKNKITYPSMDFSVATCLFKLPKIMLKALRIETADRLKPYINNNRPTQ